MDKEFKKRLTKGTLLFVIKKQPKKELIIELLGDVKGPARYCDVRYLYKRGLQYNHLGAMMGVCFLPHGSELYDTYIIKEVYWYE